MQQKPLCVDLDGTLIKSDMLFECLVRVIRRSPWKLFAVFFWLLAGRAVLKSKLAEACNKVGGINITKLPWNEPVVDFIKKEKESGRDIYLVSASSQSVVDSVADFLGVFNGSYGSSDKVNLKAKVKADFLQEKFGKGGFDYIADSKSDKAVWEVCAEKLYAGPIAETGSTFAYKINNFFPLLKALRIRQWVKNLLVFLPLLLAHRVMDLDYIVQATLGFLALGLAASGVYLFNDLLDIEADRASRIKRKRPLACGQVSLSLALLLFPLLMILGGGIAVLVSQAFFLCVVSYVALTFAYSLWIKRIVVADIVVLALFYTLRIFAGGYGLNVWISHWMLTFSMFFFFSLAALKRYTELRVAHQGMEDDNQSRGYRAMDLDLVAMFGTGSALVSVLVLALYVSSKEIVSIYSSPQLIWFLCPLLLFWNARVWLLGSRGKVDSDPVIFAVTDKVSYLVAALAMGVVLAAV